MLMREIRTPATGGREEGRPGDSGRTVADDERTVGSYSGKSVGPRAGFKLLKSHSSWYK